MANDSTARARSFDEGRKLARALLLEARSALRLHGLSEADREDLTQLVVIAALRRFHTYREEAGTVRQWIRGIARNEVRALRRREPGVEVALDEETVAGREATEEAVSQRDLLDHLLAQIPIDRRRIVILVELWGLTIREAAAVMRSSPTRTHARHQAGMAALREAADRWRQEQARHGVAALPLPPAALFAAARPDEAPAEGDERTWRLATALLGLDGEPRAANDTLDRGAGFGRETARILGRIGLALLGPIGFVVGFAMAHQAHDRTPAPLVITVAASAATSAETAPAQMEPASPAMTASSAVKAVRPRIVVRAPRETEDEALRAERALVDRGRAALSAGNVASALEALAEHARRFPRGQSAGTRERLWTEACEEARTDPRCAGRTAIEKRP